MEHILMSPYRDLEPAARFLQLLSSNLADSNPGLAFLLPIRGLQDGLMQSIGESSVWV